MNNVTISNGKPEDAETLAHIKQVIWLTTYQNTELGITPEDILAKDFLCKERSAKRAEHMAVDDGINFPLVARVDGQIAGYGRAVKSEENEIVTLYLLPEWQGKGIGSKLLQQLLNWLGDDSVIFGVVSYNKKATRFYEKFAFDSANQCSMTSLLFPAANIYPR
jgi:GNAT superfamily N-acetyltransferase